jgi:hypothetical protein
MSNAATIYALQGTGSATPGRNQLRSLTGLGSTETLVTMGTDTAATYVGANLPVPSQTAIVGSFTPVTLDSNPASLVENYGVNVRRRNYAAPFYNSASFDGQAMRLRIQGELTTSASATAIIRFYSNTTPVLAGAQTLAGAALVSAAIATTNANFIAECIVLWDSNTLKMTPIESWCMIGGTYVARGIQSQAPFALTAVNFASTVFISSIKFSAGATNVFTPIEFSLEEV